MWLGKPGGRSEAAIDRKSTTINRMWHLNALHDICSHLICHHEPVHGNDVVALHTQTINLATTELHTRSAPHIAHVRGLWGLAVCPVAVSSDRQPIQCTCIIAVAASVAQLVEHWPGKLTVVGLSLV